MPVPFTELLEATISYLQDLKARGVRYVSVSPESLTALSQPGPARVSASSGVASGGTQTAPSVTTTGRRAATPSFRDQPEAQFPPSTATASPIEAGPTLLTPSAKAQAMAELRERALVCVKCPHLAATRKNVVFGVGALDAELMFVGEAPGAEEDEQGEPFVGAAGQLLTRIIEAMGLTRETVYIANILKCRPDTPGQAMGNRKPRPEEMQTCLPYLHAQIDLIQPKVLVALGATAIEGLLGESMGITRLRGQWRIYRNIPLMPTFHPAYLLRNPALSEKRKVWEDMMQVLQKLGRPISEKQRRYFARSAGP